MRKSSKSWIILAPLGLALLVGGCDSDRATADGITGTSSHEGGERGAVFTQVDRLANPLVSEALIVKALHEEYNHGMPSTDVARWTDELNRFVTEVAGRDPAVANTLSSVLLPDMLLVFPKRDPSTAGWLSWALAPGVGYGGRMLSGDDVVDKALMAVFGPLLSEENVTPGLTTDNVPRNDKMPSGTFPYLAEPHR